MFGGLSRGIGGANAPSHSSLSELGILRFRKPHAAQVTPLATADKPSKTLNTDDSTLSLLAMLNHHLDAARKIFALALIGMAKTVLCRTH